MSEFHVQRTGMFRSYRKRSSVVLLIIFLFVLFAIMGVYGISGYVGWGLTHPQRKPITSSPAAAELQYKDVSFTSRVDGLKLKGWLILSPENRQTIIFAHGYGMNRLQEDVPLLPLVQVLISKGYNVLMFDFRNSGESEGQITSVGQFEVRDLLGAVDFIQSQRNLSSKIILYGFSMGAATAILAGAQEPTVAAVVADAPFADLESYLRRNLTVWTKLPEMPFNQTVLTMTTLITGLDAKQVSPMGEVNKLGNRPLLLIHGEADTDIPIENSELIQQKYPFAQLVRVPNAKHVQSFKVDSRRYSAEVMQFLDRVEK